MFVKDEVIAANNHSKLEQEPENIGGMIPRSLLGAVWAVNSIFNNLTRESKSSGPNGPAPQTGPHCKQCVLRVLDY